MTAVPAIPCAEQLRCRVASAGIATYPPTSSFGPRRLADFEVVWLLSGSARWRCDGEEYHLPVGSLCCARPGMYDSFEWDRQIITRHGFIHFCLEALPPDMPQPQDWPVHLRPEPGSPLLPLLDHCCRLAEGGSAAAGPRQINLAIELVLRALVSGVHTGSSCSEMPLHPALSRMLTFIQECWQERPMPAISLSQLCRVCAMSRAQLTRLSKREWGCSPMQAVRHLRVHAVAQALSSTSDSITSISDHCGYANPFHCSRAFRQVYGCSPRHWRSRQSQANAAPIMPLVRVLHYGVGGR